MFLNRHFKSYNVPNQYKSLELYELDWVGFIMFMEYYSCNRIKKCWYCMSKWNLLDYTDSYFGHSGDLEFSIRN